MLAMLAFVKAYWKIAIIVLAIAITGVQCDRHGQAKVQQKWNAESLRIAQALAENAKLQRDKEYADQLRMNKVQADATQRLEALRIDADSANAAADRLREQVGKLLTTNTVCPSSGTGSGRATTQNPGNLLAVLLDKSIQRNRELAAFADAAITASKACAQAQKQ